MNSKTAIQAINKAGALLVFPIDNRKEPASLWSHFFPRSPMRWEWDESGDNRVGKLWHLKTALSTTRQVVYTKWYQGRATYFSKELFASLLCALNSGDPAERRGLSKGAHQLLDILDSESPLSTKELKRLSGLQGRANEAAYNRALKELWSRLLIVAYGEVDDGAFPSLAVGSTRVLFEELWRKASDTDSDKADALVTKTLPSENLFLKFYRKLRKELAPRAQEPRGPKKTDSSNAKGKKGPAIPGEISFSDL